MRVSVATKLDGLCGTCRDGQVIEYDNGAVDYICTNSHPSFRIVRPVVRCSDFDSRNEPEKYEYERVAWKLSTDKSGKIVGFQPPKKGKGDD